jgi:hypothetical protein
VDKTRARTDAHYLMALGSIAFLLIGLVIISVRRTDLMDVRSAYISAQCFTQHCDPYKQSDLLRTYIASSGALPTDNQGIETLGFETQNLYLPTTLAVVAPFALLPYEPARLLWVLLTAAAYLLACWLMWNAASEKSPLLSAAMIAFYLANSGSLISTSNAGALSLSLCVISAWCFVRDRFVAAGIVCMALSLALKPHESGLVWLFFLVLGGRYSKRALQSLAILALIAVPAFLWAYHTSPQWIHELRANMQAHYAPGGIDDPGPAAALNRGTFVITDLQAIISFFVNDPSFYNRASYAICLTLLAVIVFATRKSVLTAERIWIGLAAIAALSMLPVYHRQYDAKLLILTLPAFASLWAAGGRLAKIALLVQAGGLLFTSDLPWAFFRALITHLQVPTTGAPGKVLIAILSFPVPLVLLLMCSFYAAIYSRRTEPSVLATSSK